MSMADVFNESNYRNFLRTHFPQSGDGRGRRRQLSTALNCQTSFISLVLTDRAHLNEDMAFQAAHFLNLSSDETDYFLLLFHGERAATRELKNYYEKRRQEIIKMRGQVQKRIESTKEIPFEVQAQYYSDWSYGAIHTLILNPRFRSRESIASKLHLSLVQVDECFEFLTKWGFAKKIDGEFRTSVTRLHLSSDSPFIQQHHQNWHLEALRALASNRRNQELGMNYSGVLSLAKKDIPFVRDLMMDVISKIERHIKPSKDEELVGIVMDLFGYKET
jgi:uncharacterized protein (TIGR02147 family)